MSNTQHIGYIRVSTKDQKTDRQLIDTGITFDAVFEEKRSGKSRLDRPVLEECLSYCRKGDTLHVHSMDRLARNFLELNRMIEEMNEKGVVIHFHKENLIFAGEESPHTLLIAQIMSSIAQFERAVIVERVAEGIAKAQKKGVKFGRKPAKEKERAMELLRKGELKPSEIAKRTGLDPRSIYRYRKELAKEKAPA